MSENSAYQNLTTELKRGSLTLAVLGCLRKPYYGYALLRTLQEAGIDIEANTLYPLLRRLEAQGLLSGDWNTRESRPRKYYTISTKGEEALSSLMLEWQKLQQGIDRICGKGE